MESKIGKGTINNEKESQIEEYKELPDLMEWDDESVVEEEINNELRDLVVRDDESAIKDKEDKPPLLYHPYDESFWSDIDDDDWVDTGTDEHEKMIESVHMFMWR